MASRKMPKNIHNNKHCYTNKKDITPTDKNRCPLCKAELVNVIFEDNLVMLLKREHLYILEPKGIDAFRTQYNESINIGK